VSKAIQLRLENWARCYRDQREQGKSMTGIICESLERHSGQTRGLESKPRPERDEADAKYIEQAVRTIRPISRDLLRLYYMWESPRHFICRRLKINHRPAALFDLTLSHAERECELRAQILIQRDNIRADYRTASARLSTSGEAVAVKNADEVID